MPKIYRERLNDLCATVPQIKIVDLDLKAGNA